MRVVFKIWMEVNTRVTKKLSNMPVLPLRGLLVYPTMVLHIDVGRERSIAALEHAMLGDSTIFLVTQKDLRVDSPVKSDLYKMGTLAKVKQMLKLPNGTLRILVEGLNRAEMVSYKDAEKFAIADLEIFEDDQFKDSETEALMRTVLSYFEKYAKSSNKITTETIESVLDIEEPGRLADVIASHLPFKINEKQEVLDITNIKKRLDHLMIRLHDEQEILNLEKKSVQK